MWLKKNISDFAERNRGLFTPGKIATILIGAAVSSFGIYNIHQQANITEGGVLGMILLFNHWSSISPSIISPMLDAFCYAFAFKYLGWNFIKVSIISTFSLAGFFKLWEQFPPMLPDLSTHPLIAALAGGLFVGVGVGVIVRQGGSSGGDDALALAISRAFRCRISRAYLATDITVLLLSLFYIPLGRIAFSLMTVTISSLLVDLVQNGGRKPKLETSEITLFINSMDVNEFAEDAQEKKSDK